MTAEEHNKFYYFFHDITGEAMLVHSEYHEGLLESAYEAALEYLLKLKGYNVERQVYLPMYWKDVKLNQHYCMDLVINNNVIVELKASNHITSTSQAVMELSESDPLALWYSHELWSKEFLQRMVPST